MFRRALIAAALAACTGGALAAVTADEAKQLGTTLTAVGAEKAANKDGTIPEYTGGLTSAPAGFQKGTGIRPDPYAADKPRLTITGKDAAAHADKLTEGTKELLKRYPSMRVDVYPTRRPVQFDKRIVDNTLKNAAGAKATDGGLGIENALAGFPFPIPKSGSEVMWNHLMRYQGFNFQSKYDNWNVDSAGVATLATTGELFQDFPVFDPKKIDAAKATDLYFRIKLFYLAPSRRNGEALLLNDAVNPFTQPRKAWQYLPGQRRVKLAPDIAYDTPNPGTAGLSTYDDHWVFNGAMDRYDWKLVGKKEMYVPYNNYRLQYGKNPADVTKPNHINPDMVRWELHRVWVVEATLKEGKRHIYAKRTFYIDEDSWVAVASDQYDARGQLFVSGFDFMTFNYDNASTSTDCMGFYNFVSGAYNVTGLSGPYYGIRFIDPMTASQWAPEALAGAGIR
jgi:uncharacterized protein DUF1329